MYKRAECCPYAGFFFIASGLKHWCRHVSVDIVPPVKCLARGKPGLQPNRGCMLLYATNTRRGSVWPSAGGLLLMSPVGRNGRKAP